MTDPDAPENPPPEEEILIPLHVEAGLPEAEELLQSCADLPIDRKVVFDAGNLVSVSTAYVLTIVSALNARAQSSPSVTLKDAPQPLIDAFSDLGLFESMMKMEFQ